MTRQKNFAAAIVAAFAIAACQPGAETTPGGETPAVETPDAGSPGVESPGLETPGESPDLTSPDASPGAGSPAASPALNQALVMFEALADSGITGGAILTDLGEGETAVTIGVVALGFEEPLPAQIEEGTCADLAGTTHGEAVEELVPVELGGSNTVVMRSLDELLEGEHRITLQRSAADPEVVACADVERTQAL